MNFKYKIIFNINIVNFSIIHVAINLMIIILRNMDEL